MDNKLETISNLFEGKEIRSIWDVEKEEYYFSVVDVISALSESNIPRNYWSDLKRKLIKEGSQLHENIVQLKMKAKDGKFRETDTLDTKGILRLIESVPSSKAEPFKLWLAQMGKGRIDEVFDPEIAIKRAIDYYRNHGYSDKWIEARLKGILDRNKLTDIWKENGIKDGYEFVVLMNEIYRAWSGMKASEYKEFKKIRKESLRDNMTDVEVALTDLGEIVTRELAKKHKPQGLKANRKIAREGGEVAKTARENLEEKLGETIISNKNSLNYQYIEENKKIADKNNKKNKRRSKIYMDKEFIDNALKVMKFDIDDEEKSLIQFVGMREYGVASQEKPLLLTLNLQSCIALIAYTKNFSFLAHMNVIRGNWNKDFNIDEVNGTSKCKKVEDLYNEILSHKDKISQPINIGLVLGIAPVEKEYISRRILEDDLLNMFEKLRVNYIRANRLPDIKSWNFILDSRKGEIIHDGVECGNRITRISQERKQDNDNSYRTY